MKIREEGLLHRSRASMRAAEDDGFEEALCERLALDQVQDELSPELRKLLELARIEDNQEALAERLQSNRSNVRRQLLKLYATLRSLLGVC